MDYCEEVIRRLEQEGLDFGDDEIAAAGTEPPAAERAGSLFDDGMESEE